MSAQRDVLYAGLFFWGAGEVEETDISVRFTSMAFGVVLCCARARAVLPVASLRRQRFFNGHCARDTERERERGLIKIHLKVKLNEMPYAVSLGESADRRGPPAVTRTSVIRVTI